MNGSEGQEGNTRRVQKCSVWRHSDSQPSYPTKSNTFPIFNDCYLLQYHKHYGNSRMHQLKKADEYAPERLFLSTLPTTSSQISKPQIFFIIPFLSIMERKIIYAPIGIIHSPFGEKDAPRQPIAGKKGKIEIFPEYTEGLKGLEKFPHVILIYHMHLSREYKLMVKPPMEEKLRGVFASRSPHRPNPIGIAVVKLEKVEGTMLYVDRIDAIDGTPLLDIKPHIPTLDEGKE